MIFHIQCLRELLLLCVIIFPSAYIYFLKPFIQIKGNALLSENISTILIYGLLTLMGIAAGNIGLLQITSAAGFALAAALSVSILAGAFNVAVEYAEAAFRIYIKTKKMPALAPASLYYRRFSITDFLSIVAAAVLEEFVFRQYMIAGLFGSLGTDIWLAVFLSALFYAMNHVYFGSFAVIQKFTSGIVFSLLFVLSGGNILLCAVCHTVQNLILYFYSTAKYTSKGGRKC